MLLSCRALGKGVEHRMLAEVAARAVRDGKSIIELSYRPTDRNEPARAFLEQLGAGQPVPKDAPVGIGIARRAFGDAALRAGRRGE